METPPPTPNTERSPRDGPKAQHLGRLAIYAASLTDYNHGILHGSWIDATDDEEAMATEVSAMLSKSPAARKYGDVAEEWAIHDYEGFEPLRLDEYTNLSTIARLADGIQQHGPAFAAFADLYGTIDDNLTRQFDHAYLGKWQSLTEYAENLLQDLGLDETLDRQVPPGLRPYVTIDVEGFARDLQLGGDITPTEAADGGVYLFDMNQ